MQVRSNLSAMNADRMFGLTYRNNIKSMERLSSGYRVNRAADDAAGLSISEKMRRQIRGLTQASANAQDGISMVQTAEGAMNEIHEMLQRGNELAVKAANGTLTDSDRAMIDEEIQHLKSEIDRTTQTTVFNEIQLFPEDGTVPPRPANSEIYRYTVSYHVADGTIQLGVENSTTAVSGTAGQVSTGNVLADKIANEFVPNAIAQIFDAFPSLKNATGSDTIDMGLEIEIIDGSDGTLAYAQYSYSPGGGKPIGMLIRVDVDDFSEEDAAGTGSRAEMLESTLAHELMHSVMQYNLTDGMSGRGGETYPDWFVEGTAQLSGGGYTTGWNDMLTNYANQLTGGTDNSKDTQIASYLKSSTMNGRPYGHGYLGCAYIGYLANGGGAVTGAGIAAGMDQIFEKLLNGKDLASAIQECTGKSIRDIENMFANGDNALVEFVRQLSYESKDGAGSVIAASLGTGGTDILGDTASVQQFRIDPDKVSVEAGLGGGRKVIGLQVGAEAGQHIDLDLYRIDTRALGLTGTNVKTQEDAGNAIDQFKGAIQMISTVRSNYGAVQNRLEHTILNLDNVVENTTAAESRIRDTDMAEETVKYSNSQILLQAGSAMLSQANKQPELILNLLG